MLLWHVLPLRGCLKAAAAVLILNNGMVQRCSNPPDAGATERCQQGRDCFGACCPGVAAARAAPRVWAWPAEGRLGCPADSTGLRG